MQVRNIVAAIAAGVPIAIAMLSHPAQAQEQTTQQLPLPVGQAASESFDKRWSIKFDSEIKYSATEIIGRTDAIGTVRSHVMQLPFGVALTGQPNDLWKIELGARGGYIESRQKSGTFDSRFTGMTDTTVSATTTYYGINGIQPFISINANLPTGTTVLSGKKINSSPDPDVTGTKGFGEGTNIGPTFGINIALNQNTVLALGIGHTVRGAFTRFGTGPLLNVNTIINPGDVTTATAQLGYQEGAFAFMAQAGYSWETMTTADGVAYFQSGDKIQLAAAIGYAWTDALSSKVAVSYTHTDKNKSTPPVPFGLEPANSNNDVVNVVFDTTYKTGMWALGPSVGFMYRDRNAYDSTSQQFVPAKDLWTFGGGVQYQIAQQAMLNARAAYMTGKTDSIPVFIVPDLTTRGWQLSVGGTLQF